jgi:hypothetical protein
MSFGKRRAEASSETRHATTAHKIDPLDPDVAVLGVIERRRRVVSSVGAPVRTAELELELLWESRAKVLPSINMEERASAVGPQATTKKAPARMNATIIRQTALSSPLLQRANAVPSPLDHTERVA